jgi:hypothetical protein
MSLSYRVAAVAAAATLAMPAAALAGGDGHHGHGHGKHHKHHVHVVDVCKGWWKLFKLKECETPAPAPTVQQPAPDNGATQNADVIVNIVNQPTAPLIGDVNAPAAPAAPAAAPVAATIRSSNVKCEKRSSFRIRLDKKGRPRRARVLLNGLPVSVSRDRRTALIDLRRRAKGNYTVRHFVVTRRGRLVTGTRRFTTC